MANWFIGLPIPAGAWLEALPAVPEGCRLFDAGDLHLTVAFLGHVSEDAARAAWAAVQWLGAPLEVTLGRGGAHGQRAARLRRRGSAPRLRVACLRRLTHTSSRSA